MPDRSYLYFYCWTNSLSGPCFADLLVRKQSTNKSDAGTVTWEFASQDSRTNQDFYFKFKGYAISWIMCSFRVCWLKLYFFLIESGTRTSHTQLILESVPINYYQTWWVLPVLLVLSPSEVPFLLLLLNKLSEHLLFRMVPNSLIGRVPFWQPPFWLCSV